jgi:TatA/E family protein of Tat protein translocase
MLELAMIGSGPDMIIVLIVALLVFGPNRLPEVGRQVGQLLREGRKMMSTFTDAINDVHTEVNSAVHDPPVVGEVVRSGATNPNTPTDAPASTPQLMIARSDPEPAPKIESDGAKSEKD